MKNKFKKSLILLKWIVIFIVSIFVLVSLYIYTVFQLGQKYWWYTSSNDNLFSDAINPIDMIATNTVCKKPTEDPFAFIYPESMSSDVSNNQLVVLQVKNDYTADVISILDTKGIDYGLLNYSTVTNIYDDNWQNHRIVIYPGGDRLGREVQFYRDTPHEDLITYRSMRSKLGWGYDNDVEIRISYSIKGANCTYPYVYKFKTAEKL